MMTAIAGTVYLGSANQRLLEKLVQERKDRRFRLVAQEQLIRRSEWPDVRA